MMQRMEEVAARFELRLTSRNGDDLTGTLPETGGPGEALGSRQAVADGEIVAFDQDGRPSFQRLQPRIHASKETRDRLRARRQPASYVIFDVVHLDRRSLVAEAYTTRRSKLEPLGLDGADWTVSPRFEGPAADILTASRAEGLEGTVARRDDSPYLAGKRPPAWIKVKNLRSQEVVIGGFTHGEGRRSGRNGSLLRIPDGGGSLEYVGQVGAGLGKEALEELTRALSEVVRRDSPFTTRVPPSYAKRATWVEPCLVGEVSLSEWTRDGRLRQPSWRGARADKSAGGVVREP